MKINRNLIKKVYNDSFYQVRLKVKNQIVKLVKNETVSLNNASTALIVSSTVNYLVMCCYFQFHQGLFSMFKCYSKL